MSSAPIPRFLTALAALVAASALPARASPPAIPGAGAPRFNPACRYGTSLHASANTPEAVERAMALLRASLAEYLPPGTPYALLDGGARDFGWAYAFAWLYEPGMDEPGWRERFEARGAARVLAMGRA